MKFYRNPFENGKRNCSCGFTGARGPQCLGPTWSALGRSLLAAHATTTRVESGQSAHDVAQHIVPRPGALERLVPNLLRGRGKSIGEDIDVDEDGSKHIDRNLEITTPRLRWLPTCEHMS
jgi:hypothetical protein